MNTKVIINFVIWVLTNFQHYSIIVQKVMGQILQLGLLENSQDREAETEFSTLLTAKLALVMNTKNIEEQIIFLVSKFQSI